MSLNDYIAITALMMLVLVFLSFVLAVWVPSVGFKLAASFGIVFCLCAILHGKEGA